LPDARETTNTILSWDGTDGDLSCSRYGYYFFTTVTATNFNSLGTTIKAGTPILFN
jgi:hypothetical protein